MMIFLDEIFFPLIQSGMENMVRILLRHGANVYARNKEGKTASQTAHEKGIVENDI